MIGGGMSHRGMFRRKVGSSPIPLSDLSFWYEFDNASKITEDGTNIQEIISNEINAWPATPIVNDPGYSAAGGYADFTFGSSESLESPLLEASGYPNNFSLITSGFMMMVIELDSLTTGRWLSGIANGQAASGSTSANVYGNFFGFNSGGFKLSYRGRMTMNDATFVIIDGTTVLTTGQKYLLQIYVPTTGGTYYEIDGVAQGDDVGNRFAGILDPTTVGPYRWKANMGYVQSTTPIYAGNHKIHEFISYQAYNATKYAIVETYLKTKYGIA